ncbi:MAG: DNA polymerase/3'-5' exonuclease PolX [Candidatus Micrarchaeota archaeon]|nr:DNA polymerase/3'-5' exonuclease PolX [Candidatus Micrarchaeota archaeon]
MYNTKIAEIFEEIANMLALDEVERRFEVLAYRKAALTISSLQEDVGEIYKKKGVEGLMELPGIGKGIAGSIKEYIETGKIKKYEELKKQYPIDFTNLTKIQGMGAKRTFKLYQTIGVKNIDDLRKAVDQHKIRGLEGFGERSEEEIKKGLAQFDSGKGRMLLGHALPEAEAIVKKLRDSGLVKQITIAGSTRRMRETVGDLDILVSSSKADAVMEMAKKMQEVERTIVSGPTKTTVLLKIGLTCDIRVVEDSSFGAALQYFTGNKDHNVKLREIAIKKGYKLNEYGLFDRKGKSVAGKTEEEVYSKLGLDWMEPEMRENRGEIDLAMSRKLPKLVQQEDVLGDLHVHTNHSDGLEPLGEMAASAAKLGLKYIGITDHTKSEYQARGMDDKKFVKHLEGIDKENERGGIRLLKSAEIDILKDGSLDLENKTLEMMDYRLASIHTNLNLKRDEMTKRVIKAFDSGYVDIWAHPTDRLINARPPIDVDLDKVFEAAERNNVILEIDSYPDRLDLNDENIFKARNYKVKFSIDTDSHRSENMLFLRYGIGMAKRGWLTKELVVNTLPAEKLLKLFHKF